MVQGCRKVWKSGEAGVVTWMNTCALCAKGGFKSEDTGEFLHLQHKYSKSLSWAENLNFPPKTVNNLFKFSAQDSDLEYLCWRRKIFPVSSDLKPPLPNFDNIFYLFSDTYGWVTGTWSHDVSRKAPTRIGNLNSLPKQIQNGCGIATVSFSMQKSNQTEKCC